jgi:hypothetical protein
MLRRFVEEDDQLERASARGWTSSRDVEIPEIKASNPNCNWDPRTSSWSADKTPAFKDGLLNQIHPCATWAVQT